MNALQNIEAEKALLGCVLISPHNHTFLEIDLVAGDFHLRRHSLIWAAMQRLAREDVVIDHITLADRLQKSSHLKQIGGPAYLAELARSTPSSLHAKDYAQTIQDYARRRRLVELAREIAQTALDTDNDIQVEQAKFLEAFLEHNRVTGGTVPISEWMDAGYARIVQNAENPSQTAGLQTGYIDLDRIIGGFVPGLVIIGGKPGRGKTMLVTGIAENIAAQGVPGAFFESEMAAEHMTYRIYAAETGIQVSRMRRGAIESDDWEKLDRARRKKSAVPLFVSDATGWTSSSLRAELTRLKAEQGIQFFCFDYLEMMDDRYGKREFERIAYIGRMLTRICRDLELVGFVVQKMTKSGFRGLPDLDDYSGGSSLTYDVTTALVVTDHIPESGGTPNPHICTVLVHRSQVKHFTNLSR